MCVSSIVIKDDEISLSIDDAWWNSEGLDDYPGASPGIIRLQGLNGTLRVDAAVTKERIMDVFVDSGDSVNLKIVCSGQHFIEATGTRLVWLPLPVA